MALAPLLVGVCADHLKVDSFGAARPGSEEADRGLWGWVRGVVWSSAESFLFKTGIHGLGSGNRG